MSTSSNFDSPNGNGHSNGNGRAYYNGESNAPRPASKPSNRGSDEDAIDLSKIFATVIRYKYLLAAFVVAGTIAGYVAANMMTPIYRSQGTILIQEVRNQFSYAGSDINSLVTTAFGVGMGSTIANELAVLQSREFMGRVAHNIMEAANGDMETYPITQAMDEDGKYRPATVNQVRDRLLRRVNLERVDRESDIVSIVYESPSPVEAKLVVDVVIDTYNAFSTDENRRMSRQGLDFLERERDTIEERLTISEEQMREFMSEEGLVAIDEQTKQFVQVLTQLQMEYASAQVEQVAVDRAIENYRRELDDIRPGLGEQIVQGYGPQITRLQFAISELQTERELLLSRNPELRSQPELEPRVADINRRINELVDRVRESVSRLVEQDERYLGLLGSFDGNIIGNISDLRRQLIELEVKEQQLSAQMEVLNEKITDIEHTLDRLPDNITRFARLRRDVQLYSNLFTLLQQQAAELAIWEQTQMGYGRVVDYGTSPDPELPAKPRTLLILLAGFFVGGFSGITFVAIRELSQTKIRSVEKLKEKGLQLLAVIPDLEQIIRKNFGGAKEVTVKEYAVSTDLIGLLDPISPPSEAYRRLFNNLLYAQPDNPYRVLMCTSAAQGEGKTTTISNLAVITAESGFKTVIIDCDFRRPRLHKEFGLKQDEGMCEWLFNEKTLDEVLKTTVVPNVNVITAGRMIPNPANVVQSKRMQQIIQELKEKYDYVFIDAPPYGIITDAAPLMRQSDGVILMTRFNQTQLGEIDHLLENLRAINAHVIGCVLGAYDPKKSTGYGYTESYYKYSYTNYNRYSETKA